MIRSAIAFVILGAGVSFGFLDEKSSSGPTIVQVVVGLDGFCPVSYQTEHKAVLGSPNYASEYAGYTYFLASEEAKKKFDADPSRYAPRIGGLCTVALGGPYGNRFWGDPRVFAVVNDRLYLLSSQRAKLSFDKKPLEYIAKAEELYRQPWLKGMCPVSYKLEGKPVEGKSEFQQEFRGHIYYLASKKAVEILKKDGADAIPQYDGYCAEGVSRGKLYPVDPTVFTVFAGKTYLFFDEGTKAKFMQEATTLVDKADAAWPSISVKLAPGSNRPGGE